MASTSPYQNNDYQATSTFRPYQLPVNDIMKGLMAQNQFWNEGALRVKNTYDNALDLKLRTTENRETRDSFIKNVQKDIAKLSSMNLADPDVQRNGINLFNPLLSDQDIIGEDYVNRNFEKELGVAESFRQKDNGKEYNPLSEANIRYEQSLLDSELNRKDGWKSIAPTMSKYTPYTDVSGEIKKIKDVITAKEMKDAVATGNSWYIQEITKKGISKDRLLAAIQEMGSPALKAQMAVEGRNTYYNQLKSNPEGATEYFQRLASSYYDGKISELKGSKAKLEYEKVMLPKGDEYKGKSDYYDNQIETINKLINEAETEHKPKYVNSFSNLHDVNNLASNISKVERLWQQSTIDNLAGNLAYENVLTDIKPNAAKIAQENIALASARINQEYDKMRMDNMNSQADRDLKKLELSLKYGNAGSGNPLLPGGGNGGGIPFDPNDVATKNEGDKRSEAQSAIDEVSIPSDERMRSSLITNLLGDSAWQGIQEKTPYDSKLGEGVLLPTDIEKAATFMKAYGDKYAGTTISGTNKSVGALYFQPGLTLDYWKDKLKNMPISQFKKWVGNMVKNDPEFTADLVGSDLLSKDPKKSIEFRASYNKLISDQINTSKFINDNMPQALGEFAKYFKDNGRVNITDSEINNAYKEYLAKDGKITVISTGTVTATGDPLFSSSANTRTSRELTPQEIEQYKNGKLKLKPNQVIENIGISFDQFKSKIRARTDQVYLNLKTENNQHGEAYSYVGREKEVVPVLSRMESTLPEIQGTDANPDAKKVWDFIMKHSDQIISHDLVSPKVGELLPTIRFKLGNFKEVAGEEGMVEKVNNTRFKTTGAPSEWSKTNNSSARGRWTGANLVHVPFKTPTGVGEINIINQSRNKGYVDPLLSVKDLYVLNENGTSRKLTPNDLESAFQSRFSVPLSQYLQTSQDGVNEFFTEFATNVERHNREIKEKSKK